MRLLLENYNKKCYIYYIFGKTDGLNNGQKT